MENIGCTLDVRLERNAVSGAEVWPLFVYLCGCGRGRVHKCLKLNQSETKHHCIPLLPEDIPIIFFWKSISWSKSDVDPFLYLMQKEKKTCKHMFLWTTKILLKKKGKSWFKLLRATQSWAKTRRVPSDLAPKLGASSGNS